MDSRQVNRVNFYSEISAIPADVQQCLLTIAQFGCYPDEVRQWYIHVRAHFGAVPIIDQTSFREITDPSKPERRAMDPQRRIMEWLSPDSHVERPLNGPTQLTTINEVELTEGPRVMKRRSSEMTPESESCDFAWTAQSPPKRTRVAALPRSRKGSSGNLLMVQYGL